MLLDGFIIRPSYVDTHLSCALCNVIGSLKPSLHQLEIEIERYAHNLMEEQICQQCHWVLESEKHYAFSCDCFLSSKREVPLPLQTRIAHARSWNTKISHAGLSLLQLK